MTTKASSARRDDLMLATLEAAADRPNEPPPTIWDVMRRDVATCRAEDSLDAVARIMWEWPCGAVPVVDDDGRPIAMITDRDICMAAYTQGQPLRDMKVRSAMSSRLFTAHCHDTVSAAERTMRCHAIRRLPVVDDRERLVGVLSLSEIVAHARLAGSLGRDGLSPQAIAATVAAVAHAPKKR